ncbi:hypothetical protein AC1031_003807 [Aphanomyces cochlioides]|nr:hypothetical protein AC1031_003807 [Aphanomyces cochlioides]
MQSLLRSVYHNDDDEPTSGYTESQAGLGRGLLGEGGSSYYQSRSHTRMKWVGGFLVCLAVIPLVMWPSKSTHAVEVTSDDAKLLEFDPNATHNDTAATWTRIPESAAPTTLAPSLPDPTEELTPLTTEAASDSNPPTKLPVETPSPSAIGFQFPPECSEEDIKALEAGQHTSNDCRTAYKLLAMEEGGKAFIHRQAVLKEFPVECSPDDITALESSADHVLSEPCLRAFEEARQVQINFKLEDIEDEVEQLKAALTASAAP